MTVNSKMKMVVRATTLILTLVIRVSSGSEAKCSGRMTITSIQAQDRHYYYGLLTWVKYPTFHIKTDNPRIPSKFHKKIFLHNEGNCCWIVDQEPRFKSHHELIPMGFKGTGASISSVKKVNCPLSFKPPSPRNTRLKTAHKKTKKTKRLTRLFNFMLRP